MKRLSHHCSLLVVGMLLLAPIVVFAQTTFPMDDATEVKAESGSSPVVLYPRSVIALVKLYELRFWMGKSYSIKEDANRQAIIAFQKLAELPPTGLLTDSTMMLLFRTAITPHVRDSLHRKHIEVDLNHQVLFVVDSNDQITRILSVSTGNGQEFVYPGDGKRFARTPRGKLRVYHRVSGWRKSPLGLMYYPMYILGGFAIHGATSVPPKPVSHGCIRIPMFAAKEVFRITPIGTTVVVFGENPKPKE